MANAPGRPTDARHFPVPAGSAKAHGLCRVGYDPFCPPAVHEQFRGHTFLAATTLEECIGKDPEDAPQAGLSSG